MIDSARFVELKASGNLPSPKGAALKVIELCQRENVTLPEIIQVLQLDPAMVGRILKLANSAAFARSRPVAALTPDVLLSIGIQAVRQVVLAFALVSENRHGRCPGFDYGEFWSRSVATGVAAQLIGAATRAAPPTELFTVGLLANVGRLGLAALYPDRYGELLARAGGPYSPTLDAMEREAFGHDHLEVAAAMMRDWGLPKLFTDAVLFHRSPQDAEFGSESRSARLANGLNLATMLADVCFLPEAQRVAGFTGLRPLAERLGIADGNLAALGDQMLREWKEWGALLEVTVSNMPSFTELEAKGETAAARGTGDKRECLCVLVVDDDATVRILLQKLLTAAGHEVHLARDGREGLVQALQHQPQIVITDLVMGEQGGLQLIRQLRQTDIGRSIYIMVLTIFDDEDKLSEAFDTGADDYLVKPVAAKALLARLKAGMRTIREQQSLRREQEELRRRLLELSIANQRAQEAALTDVLTGLYNRRHAIDRLAQEWAEAERGHRPLCILSIDIDHFKAVNDTHGHDIGDAALRQFAEILRAFSRAADVPCRFGGEEFLLIAPDTGQDGAVNLAERIRRAVEAKPLVAAGVSLRLTASVGVAEKLPGHTNVDQLIKAGDEALYRAKQNGRNRVERARH